jgi:hypothetical protein
MLAILPVKHACRATDVRWTVGVLLAMETIVLIGLFTLLSGADASVGGKV